MADYDYTDVNTGIDYTDDEMEDIFEGSISGLHDDVEILGYSFSPGKALRVLDYTAFREEFNNWVDAQMQEGNYREYVDSPECEDCKAPLSQDDVTESLAIHDRLVCPTCGQCEVCGESMGKDEAAQAIVDHGVLFCQSCEEDYEA